MFAAISLFIKNKLFSMTGIFVLVFVFLFGIFLLPNGETVMAKLGIETKTSLQVKLAEAQKDLKSLGDVNANLNKTIEELEKRHQVELQALKDHLQTTQIIQEETKQVTEKRKTTSKTIQQQLKQKTVETQTSLTIPKQEYNELSAQNIASLHEAFDQLETVFN